MAIAKRGRHQYLRVRLFGGKVQGVKTPAKTKAEAKQIEMAVVTACRSGDYRALDPVSREVCVRLFKNQGWEIPPDLEDLGRKCVAAFEARERFFHIEFFLTGEGKYVGLEINMRPPGGFTTDMFNYACDIDVYRAWARLLVDGRVALDYTRKYHCCYASRKNSLSYRYSHEEIMRRFGPQIVQVASVPGVFSSALGDVGYIFRSPDMAEIDAIVRAIHASGNGEG